MTPERWQRLTELFDAALDREPADRSAFLAAACADDPALRRELEAVLDSHDRAGGFGETPAFVVTEHRRHGALEPGVRLGRYEIVALLGAGGMGEVYRARDPQLGREVGIKILHRGGDVTSDQLARFEREARAVAALNHPSILAVYDIGTDGGAPYVVSELLEGETLRARLQHGPLPLDQAIEYARHVVSGLTAAHDKGIVHRDIKPENVFITNGRVKILDFGLAKQVGAAVEGRLRHCRVAARPDQAALAGRSAGADRPGAQAAAAGAASGADHSLTWGTAGYMSPEQMRGQQADARSDVFAVGAVLYEMLAGRRAFAGESAAEKMNAVFTTDPPDLAAIRPDLPASLARAVHRCLEKDPQQRFASMSELGAALDGVAPRARRWRLPAAALLVVSLAAAGWLVGMRQPAPRPGASGRPALAVMAFDDRSGDPALAWLSDGLPSMFITALAQTPGLDLVSEDRRDVSGTLLAGSVFKAGNDLRVEVRVQDVATGRVLAATSESGSDIFTIVDVLTARVRDVLQLDDSPPGRPLRDVTTASLEAYQLHVRALDAFRNVRRGDARTLLEEALRIDPSFAMARVQLALVLERLGEPVEAAAHRRIVELDRLPERQRLLVEAKREFDVAPLRARAIAERLLERYPDEEEGYDLIIHTLTYTRDPVRWKEALAFMQRWARAIPGPGSGHFHNHYGYILVDNGLFAEAEQEFRAYIRVSPDEANPYDSLAELFLITSRPADAIEHYTQALRRNPLFGASYWGRAYAEAMLGRYRDAVASVSKLDELGPRSGVSAATIHMQNAFIRARAGRYREADTHLAAATRESRARGDAGSELDSLLLASIIALERGDRARVFSVLRDADRVASAMPADVMQKRRTAYATLMRGTMEARAGRMAAARTAQAALQQIAHDNDEIQTAWQQLLAAEIALAEGALDEADAAFRAGEYRVPPSFSIYPVPVVLNNNNPSREGPARVSAARGDVRQAVDLYRRLNEPDIASPWADVVDPRLVLAGARLAARASDRATATAEYTRFLDFWQDADPDLPELAEARRYLSRR